MNLASSNVNESPALAPPRWMILVAEFLTPRYQRDIVSGDLRAFRCKSHRQCASFAASSVLGIIRDQMRASFNIALLAGEAVFLCFPVFIFHPHVTVLSLLILAALLLSLLRMRDAYAYPAQGTPAEMVLDAAYVLGIVIFFKMGFAFAAPRFDLSLPALALVALGAIAMCQWRMIFHREDPPEPVRRELKEKHVATWHMNVLINFAGLPIMLTGLASVPGSEARDNLLAFLQPLMMGLAWRLKRDDWKGADYRPPITLFSDPERDELSRQLALLPVRARKDKFPTDLVLEALYFVLPYLPLLQAVWLWAVNDPAAARVDWFQVAVNAGAIPVLAGLWVLIKKMNRKFAAALEEQIQKRRAVSV